MQPEHGFNLQGRYPSGGNGFKAAQIYELLAQQSEAIEPYRVCRRVNILRDYPDDKIKIYP